ncbi:hypothetical protein F5H01DRAFT_28969 [Linnemannia elongata]|nr:hypothetical protein F5H01DRAFT_28969 [Linnemannia elongata]
MHYLVEHDPHLEEIIPFVLVSVAITIILTSALLVYRKHEKVVVFIRYYIIFLKYLFIVFTFIMLFTATLPATFPVLEIMLQDNPSNLSTLAWFMWLSSIIYYGLFYLLFSHKTFLELSTLFTLFLLLNSLVIVLRYNKQHADIRNALRIIAAFQAIATGNFARDSVPVVPAVSTDYSIPVEQDNVRPYSTHIPDIAASSATRPILQQAIENEPATHIVTYGSLAR